MIFYLSSCSLPNAVSDDFEGKFVYTVKSPGNTPNPNDSINYQIVYAKDSMLRIDNFTPIGKQIYIKHIPKNRAYILMDLGVKKVAIQTIPDTLKDDDKYIFEHKAGASRFAGLKGKNIKVTDTEQDTTIIMNYSPTISPKYTTALKNIPGLPLKYALFSNGTWIQYKLIEMEEKTIDIDLFGIPSDHEIITLDEFIDIIKE
ncbi:hypothetical protein CW751_10485 [Brumimicrobium salinarum]|uniref:DUF4412 domain-containing protein n=1 Tax=Brumimicrobium salinarum TaxID=2058658 RepID=A0A2I0R116_9FLAO|nr:hypothetical protein CW751_10485 [Brumimicrobium salinarum]